MVHYKTSCLNEASYPSILLMPACTCPKNRPCTCGNASSWDVSVRGTTPSNSLQPSTSYSGTSTFASDRGFRSPPIPPRFVHGQQPVPVPVVYGPDGQAYMAPPNMFVPPNVQFSSYPPMPSGALRPATPDAERPPLSSSTPNSPQRQKSRKRKPRNGEKEKQKRQKRNNGKAVPGAGPIANGQDGESGSETEVDIGDARLRSTLSSNRIDRAGLASERVASDVWYFMLPLESNERPNSNDCQKLSETSLNEERPKGPFIGCRLCIQMYVFIILH